MSYVTAQDEILAQLRTIKGVEVYEGVMSANVIAKLEDNTNQMRPFIAVDFSAIVRSHKRVQGIVGAAYDTHEGSIMVHAIASDNSTARKVIQSARDVLLGFVPTNCGELNAETYGGIGQNSVMVNPSRFAQVQPFVFFVNSDL